MADADLPVYSFRVNWAEGITERLTFLTTVLKGEEGAEQRYSRRVTPRREAEVDFLLLGPERTFYDLWIHRLAGSEFMAPLYWDVGVSSNKLTAAATDRIDFDTRFTEFRAGDLAILQRDSALTFEVVEIDAVDDGGLDLTANVLSTWNKGTRVMPLRRASLADMGSMTHYSAKVAGISAKIGFTVANPFTPLDLDETIYGGLPVFLQESNWVDDLDVNLARDIVKLDNDTGLPYQVDPTGRSNIGQAHAWLLKSREEQHLLRSFLYARRGRAEAFWLPTFKADLELAQTLASAATQAIVKNCGLVYTEVPTSGRDHLAIFPKGSDPILRRITATHQGTTPATEKVDLDLAPGLDLSPGLARKISFLDTAKFDQDEFEINHLSATVAEMNSVLRTFKNTRDPAGPIYYPIPDTEMGTDPCGPPGPCYIQEPYIRFRQEFLGPMAGHDGRIGLPALGWWCYAFEINHGLHGPNELFYCYNDLDPETGTSFGQWKELLDSDVNPLDDWTVGQSVEIRIQGGTGTAECPSVGDRYEKIRLLVHKPGWAEWRSILADEPNFGTSNFEEVPDAASGIGGFHSSGFPGTMWFWMPGDDVPLTTIGYGAGPGGTPGWGEYTRPYEGI